jgi:hypothetical protein
MKTEYQLITDQSIAYAKMGEKRHFQGVWQHNGMDVSICRLQVAGCEIEGQWRMLLAQVQIDKPAPDFTLDDYRGNPVQQT